MRGVRRPGDRYGVRGPKLEHLMQVGLQSHHTCVVVSHSARHQVGQHGVPALHLTQLGHEGLAGVWRGADGARVGIVAMRRMPGIAGGGGRGRVALRDAQHAGNRPGDGLHAALWEPPGTEAPPDMQSSVLAVASYRALHHFSSCMHDGRR